MAKGNDVVAYGASVGLVDLKVVRFAFIVLTDAGALEVPFAEVERAPQRSPIRSCRHDGSVAASRKANK